MNQITKIKGCPFCGSQPEIHHLLEGTPYEAYFIRCTNKKCECDIRHPYPSALEVINAWNARTNTEASIQDNLFKEPERNAIVDIPTEKMDAFKDRFTEKFGEQSIWFALMLLPMIDKKTWKFPDYFSSASYIPEIMKFLEEDDITKELFSNGDSEDA